MDFGAHLPLIDFGTRATLPGLKSYAQSAAGLGYRYLCANDHLLFSRPWLDGPTALAAVIAESQDMTLATTVSLPVIRGPAQLAKTLAAIDILSDGRLVIGVGPGSSARDYAAAGISFDERWPRFGEAIPMLRALLAGDQAFEGTFYSSRGIDLEPRPAQRPAPPIWVATWGSPAGLRRVARTGDGWLASAYNTTPELFGEGLARLTEALVKEGRAEPVPNAIGTAWLYVTEDIRSAERMLADVLAPLLNRPVEELRSLSLPIGPAEVCAERIAAFADAGRAAAVRLASARRCQAARTVSRTRGADAWPNRVSHRPARRARLRRERAGIARPVSLARRPTTIIWVASVTASMSGIDEADAARVAPMTVAAAMMTMRVTSRPIHPAIVAHVARSHSSPSRSNSSIVRPRTTPNPTDATALRPSSPADAAVTGCCFDVLFRITAP